MKFISQNKSYSNRFISHFLKFVQNYQLFEPQDRLLVAVSGGMDSVALLWCLKIIQSYGYSNYLRVIHINHGTRSGQKNEEDFVNQFCKHLDIPYHVDSFSDLNLKSNFEYKARLKRYESFYEFALPDEKIVLAHHIDDSFEWTMLQSLRSASIEGLVGIPVKNHRVIRPFMCVTKEQILKFILAFDLPFVEDPTNEQIKYERNFIRNEVIPVFHMRYKKYLKHYVYRHNEIARRLGIHLKDKIKSDFNLRRAQGSVLIYSLNSHSDYSGINDLIIEALKYLNPNSRGSVSVQIDKTIEALKNKKYGPISFTNGIQAYLDFNMVLLTKRKPVQLKAQSQSQIYSYDEFCNYLNELMKSKNHQLAFPFFVIVSNGNLDKRKFQTTFNIKTVNELKETNVVYYSALRLKKEWSKKRNRHKALRLSFVL